MSVFHTLQYVYKINTVVTASVFFFNEFYNFGRVENILDDILKLALTRPGTLRRVFI